jgi:hypothetical protein
MDSAYCLKYFVPYGLLKHSAARDEMCKNSCENVQMYGNVHIKTYQEWSLITNLLESVTIGGDPTLREILDTYNPYTTAKN